MPEAHRSPTLSIGVPLYNGEAYLEIALESILNQTFRDIEVVICDNASTDRSEQICRRFAAQDPRIRYHRNRTNIGLVANFSKVFELSSGSFFKWNSYDDLCEPTLFEVCLKALADNPEAACAFSLAKQIDENGNVTSGPLEPELMDDFSSEDPLVRIKAAILKDGWSGIIHGIFRRHVFASFMPYRPYFGNDRVLMTQLALYGRSVPVEPELFVQRCHSKDSSSRTMRELADIHVGRETKGIIFPMGRAFIDYLMLFWASELTPLQKTRAASYLLRHGMRKDVIKNLIIPGPRNYFGLDLDLFRKRKAKNEVQSLPDPVQDPAG